MLRGLINGYIWNRSESALLIDENIISFIGSDEEVKEKLNEKDELIDLKGMMIMPGFIDSHMHLLELGYYLSNVQLEDCTSSTDVMNKVKQRLSTIKENEWVIGRGYNEDAFEDRARPDKKMLDTISTDVPIYLTRTCGHIVSVNSKVLEIAGIHEDTVIDGGKIDYENGIVEEAAINLIHDRMPKADVMQLEDYILKGIAYANSCGITTAGSDDFLSVSNDYKEALDAFEKLSYQDRLNIRVNEQCEFNTAEDMAQFFDDGYTFEVGDDHFKIGPLKLILDGSLGARTAALTKKYEDDPSTEGYLLYTDEEALLRASLAARFNMPTICHAIGDLAVDQALYLFDETVYEGNPFHAGLVHCQIMREDQIKKVIDKKISCYYQTIFKDYDASIIENRVGKELADTSYPYKTLYEGTLCSNGSDAPVEMPSVLKGIQLAVNNTSISYPDKTMQDKECLSIAQAVDSFTVNGAKQLFMEDKIGKVEEGYYADLTVLDQDLNAADPSHIQDINVMMTIQDGRTVFER